MFSKEWWGVLAILELERLEQEDQEFKFSMEYKHQATLSYTVRPCLKEKGNYAKLEFNTMCRSAINWGGGLGWGWDIS